MSKNEDWKEVVENLTKDPVKIEWVAELGKKLHERKTPNECMVFNLQIAVNLLTDGMDVIVLNDDEYYKIRDKIVEKPLIIDVPGYLLEKEKDKHITNVVSSFINNDIKTASKIYIYDLCANLVLFDTFSTKTTLTVRYGISPINIEETEPEIEAINEYLILRNEYKLDSLEIKQLSKSQRMYLLFKYKKNNVKQING